MITQIKQLKNVFYFLLILSFSAPCFAIKTSISIQQSFDQANKFYRERKYDKAITAYETIRKSGYESGAIYYNLGNCFMKKQEWGKAILNYERAKRLIPRDHDLKTNSDIARSKIAGNTFRIKKDWKDFLVKPFFNNTTIDELTVILIVLYLLLIGIFITALFKPRAKRVLASSAAILFLLFIIGNIALYDRIKTKEALITSANASIRFEPFESSTLFFDLPQGAKVRILESKDGWTKIQRSDKKSGWTQKENLETL